MMVHSVADTFTEQRERDKGKAAAKSGHKILIQIETNSCYNDSQQQKIPIKKY